MADKTWAALIRGINLGPHKKVPMAELRTALEALGFTDVRTLLQSGNAVFTAPGPAASLEKKLESCIEAEFGHDVTVMVRSAAELKKAVAANPFAKKKVDVKHLQAAFLSAKPAAKKLSALDAGAYAPDEFASGDRVIYLRMPNGFMGSKLPDWEKVLGVRATVRTWSTVTKLDALVNA